MEWEVESNPGPWIQSNLELVIELELGYENVRKEQLRLLEPKERERLREEQQQRLQLFGASTAATVAVVMVGNVVI